MPQHPILLIHGLIGTLRDLVPLSGWNVPDWAMAGAASVTRLPGGHLMMVEDPEGFVLAVAGKVK